MAKNGIAICTFNRAEVLGELIEKVVTTKPDDCQVVVCDDGSTDDTSYVVGHFPDVVYLRGPNKGVAHNKNRALVALLGCLYLAILEDDLIPTSGGWFEKYVAAAEVSGIHHFCRVQDKEVPEVVPPFYEAMARQNLTPIYGPSPRGDLTFITKKVVDKIGGFNPDFLGVGYAHGEWSNRAIMAGLVPHPNKWVDIKEARDLFEQKGDTVGGRWNTPESELTTQKKRNRAVYRRLKATKYIYSPLFLS